MLSRGYQTKFENNGNSRGGGYDKHPWNGNSRVVGGLEQKCPPSGRYGYFLELHTLNKELKVRILADKPFNSVMLTGCFIMLFEQLLKALSWM